MAATSRGVVASAVLQGRVVANLSKPPTGRASFSSSSSSSSSSGRSRGFMLATSRSFRAFRTIKKSTGRPKRSSSRVFMRLGSAPSAVKDMAYFPSSTEQPKWEFKNFASRQDGGETFKVDGDEVDNGAAGLDERPESSEATVDTVNEVLADIVDGQKYLKETGRTKARLMKRRALVVSLALGALRDPLNGIDSRLGSLRRAPSVARLSRTPSAHGFARTAELMSQLSFGASRGAR